MGKKNEKRILEFDSIDEVLEFLKKHENIKIQVSRMIEYNGFYQLLDDKKDEAGHTLEEIKNIAEAEGYDLWGDSPDEDYDLNKPVYEASAGIEQWANGYTSKATLIKILEKAKQHKAVKPPALEPSIAINSLSAFPKRTNSIAAEIQSNAST